MKLKLKILVIVLIVLSLLTYLLRFALSSSQTFEVNQSNNASKILDYVSKDNNFTTIEILDLTLINEAKFYYNGPALIQMTLLNLDLFIDQAEIIEKLEVSRFSNLDLELFKNTLNDYLFDNNLILDEVSGYMLEDLNSSSLSELTDVLFEERLKLNLSRNYPTFIQMSSEILSKPFKNTDYLVMLCGFEINLDSDEIVSFIYVDLSKTASIYKIDRSSFYNYLYRANTPAYVY